MGTVCHRGLKLSEFGLLMSTPNSESFSLLGQTVPMQGAPQILKKEGFFYSPLIIDLVRS